MEQIVQTNAYGGVGRIFIDKILDAAQLNGKCKMFARVTVPAGSSLGFHKHEGDAEAYFLLSGEALYDDDGVKRKVKAGDTVYVRDGHGHSLDNISGGEDCVFIALIIPS